MEVPFERIGMDLIGPLERSARGHRFALVLVDYATRYPEAVPLRSISAKSIAEALFRLISRVGIPKDILTDQGTAFMSRTLKELYELLGIKSIRTSVYHPQTKNQAWSSLVFHCRHSSFYSFRSSSVGLETGEWRRCRSLSFTPPASLRSHGSRPRPTRHSNHKKSNKHKSIKY